MLYDLYGHNQMISDQVRMSAYAQALRQSVEPGSVVVDLGTGTGVFALLACRLGARQVYAIEQDEVIEVARQLAAANHCLDRIQFIQDDSARVTLPEQADVMVSDLRDILPWFRRHIPIIADARRRFLKPGGALIPKCDTVWAAPVEVPELFRRPAEAWGELPHGFNLELVCQLAANSYERARVKPKQMLAEPARWATLDYAVIDDHDTCAKLAWRVTRDGLGHGFIAWFDTTLAEGVQFSNGPRAPQAIYGSLFFPWPEPLELRLGDELALLVRGNLVQDEYIWSWETSRVDPDRPETSRVLFKQSTFHGAILSPARLRRFAGDHIPALNDEGRIDQCILAMMDGSNSIDEIAGGLMKQFPERFAKWEDVLSRVGTLSLRYSR